MKRLVVPGELIAAKPVRLDNTYVEGGKTYARSLGVYDDRGVVALEGAWRPRIGDSVVGAVKEVNGSVCVVDVSPFVRGLVILRRGENGPEAGEIISANVKDVENRRTVILEEVRILSGGMIVRVKPAKVPRLIGKGNTMLNQISEMTATQIVVGMNGRVWLSGAKTALAVEAIARIEEEAHVPGLTMRIKEMLERGNVEKTKESE